MQQTGNLRLLPQHEGEKLGHQAMQEPPEGLVTSESTFECD